MDIPDPLDHAAPDSETPLASREVVRIFIRRACELSGLNPTQLARSAGLAPSTLNRFLNTDVKHLLSTKTLLAIRDSAAAAIAQRHAHQGPQAIEAARAWLDDAGRALGVAGPTGHAAGVGETQAAFVPRSDVAASRRAEAQGELWTRRAHGADMIPVFGAARGGDDQEMFLEDGPIDHVPRPPSLQNVRKAYALQVVGDSMDPKYLDGQIVFVNPFKRPTPRNGVVIYKKPGNVVLLKEFVAWRTDSLRVREYQPERREFDIPRTEIREVNTVVGTEE